MGRYTYPFYMTTKNTAMPRMNRNCSIFITQSIHIVNWMSERTAMKKLIYTAMFLLITALLLIYPSDCVTFSLFGLNLWFRKMVPALLPFMILSGMMIRMNLTDKIVYLLRPLLQPIFRLRPALLYAIVVGFLCGFPMGARVVADLYERNQINKSEATYLLAFCNNIGPIYFLGFALPTISLPGSMAYLIGMYGLPLLYGVILRFTVYRKQLEASVVSTGQDMPAMGLMAALDESIIAGMEGITRLGGYMIFFNLLNIIPFVLMQKSQLTALIGCFLEITGGIQAIGYSDPRAVLILLSFGGLSCLAQTNSCIRNTDLSFRTYLFHKLMITMITWSYYIMAQLPM